MPVWMPLGQISSSSSTSQDLILKFGSYVLSHHFRFAVHLSVVASKGIIQISGYVTYLCNMVGFAE